MLAAGDDGGSIVVWAVNYEDGPILEASNALTGHAVYKYKISDNSFPITAIEWSTNESDVIGAVSQDAMCAIRNVSTGAKLATLRWTKIPEKSPAKVATTQQNKLKAKTITLLGNATIVAWPIVPPDQRMDTWDVAHEGRLLGANRTHNDDAIRTHNDIGWSPDGKRVVACLKGQPLFWNTNTWQPEFDISPRFDAYSAAWAPSGEVVAFGDKDLIRLWSCREGRELERIEGQSGRITSMHFSFDGGTLVSVSDSGTIRLWQVGSAVPLAVFLTDTKPVKVNEYIPSIRLPVIGDAFDIMMPMDRKKVHEAKTVSVPLSNKDRRRLSPSYSPLLSAN